VAVLLTLISGASVVAGGGNTDGQDLRIAARVGRGATGDRGHGGENTDGQDLRMRVRVGGPR